jgi:hypothetical protein
MKKKKPRARKPKAKRKKTTKFGVGYNQPMNAGIGMYGIQMGN